MTSKLPLTQQKIFFTPDRLVQEQISHDESARGPLLIASCSSGAYLAKKVVARYQNLLAQTDHQAEILYLDQVDYRFSDSESCVRLNHDVSGHDVFLFQALQDPTTASSVDQNYMAFLIAARAFREWGANKVTGVLPYLAYARQDKPTKFQQEPTTAKLMADLSIEAGLDRLVTWHPHSSQIQGFYGGVPVDSPEVQTFFVNEFEAFKGREDVIVVAPDAGASKFVTHFSRSLSLNSAIASKFRPKPEEVTVSEVIGNFDGKQTAIVLDDMISSSGTVHALIRQLVEEKDIKTVYLAVSHNLCMKTARERLQDLHRNYALKKVIVTNSIPQTQAFQALPFISVRCLADTLARVINRIHYNRSVIELFNNSHQA